MFERWLAVPAAPGAERDSVVLLLVSARLNQGDTTAAARALQLHSAARPAAWHLRAGLIAARQGRGDTARTELDAITPGTLPADERAWFYFLQGMVADADKDAQHLTRALAAYGKAADAAVSEPQRARIIVARDQTRLAAGEVSEAKAAELLGTARRDAGKSTGHLAAREYATELFALRRSADAVAFLQAQLRALPAAPTAGQRAERDNYRFLLGVGAGAREGAGRVALEDLLADGDNRSQQQAALQLLTAASTDGPARELLRLRLDGLITPPEQPPHPLLEELLLARAQLSLNEDEPRFAAADADARKLLERFNGSKLTAAALGVRLAVAWELKHYREAADFADKARVALLATEKELHAALGVLQGEALFRAGETAGDSALFKSAASAYEKAFAERPVGISPSDLIFQRVLAMTKAGQHEEAGRLLDSFSGSGTLDPANRWQAEWNLAKALQTAPGTEPERAQNLARALARVDRLLADGGTTGGFPPELRAQMGWLQARLALDTGAAERARALAQSLHDAVKDLAGLRPEAREEIAAHALLLQARATFALAVVPGDKAAETARDKAALELMERLRTEHPKSEAAMDSYLVGADYFASPGRDQIAEAQGLLTRLAENFPDNKTYAPLALYQKAVLEAGRGQEINLNNALEMLDPLFNNKNYAGGELGFLARRKQAELYQELGQRPQAQQIYELLLKDYAQHSEAQRIRLALADVHHGLRQMENARSIYAQLQYQDGADPDVRVEAGCKLGELQLEQGDKDKADETWFALGRTFLPVASDQAPALGVTGRYWLDRALTRRAELLVEQGRREEALGAFAYIVSHGLPSAKLAAARRDTLRGGSPQK